MVQTGHTPQLDLFQTRHSHNVNVCVCLIQDNNLQIHSSSYVLPVLLMLFTFFIACLSLVTAILFRLSLSADKMKDSNANGDRKSLVLNGRGFQILLFTAQKSSGDSQNFNAFPSGDESSV